MPGLAFTMQTGLLSLMPRAQKTVRKPTHAPTVPTAARRHRSLPDLRALEAFVTVCDAGSMAAAAQRLGVSQSAVSQLVRALEHDQGVQLFDREVRPAQPTRAGRVLQELANDLLTHARTVSEQMRSAATSRLGQGHQQIRLGCVDSFAATVGPELIRALSGSARQMQLWSGLTPGLSEQLQARELDMAICTETTMADARIVQRPLLSEAWVAVFPKGKRQAQQAPLDAVRDLKVRVGDLPLIRYSQRSVIGQQIDRFLRHVGMQPARRFEFDATDPLLSLVAAGLGWAITTPLCLWQSRAWLSQVQVLPLPATRLGRREFFLLCREAEWGGFADEVARLTHRVLKHDTLPALRKLMPALPPEAITVLDSVPNSLPSAPQS